MKRCYPLCASKTINTKQLEYRVNGIMAFKLTRIPSSHVPPRSLSGERIYFSRAPPLRRFEQLTHRVQQPASVRTSQRYEICLLLRTGSTIREAVPDRYLVRVLTLLVLILNSAFETEGTTPFMRSFENMWFGGKGYASISSSVGERKLVVNRKPWLSIKEIPCGRM